MVLASHSIGSTRDIMGKSPLNSAATGAVERCV